MEFELETDHHPLESIFSPRSKPCARIERWVLRLQSFRYKVVNRKGKANIADPLSRLYVTENDKAFDEECEQYIRAIYESAAIDIVEIERAVERDPELLSVRESLRTGKWTEHAKKFEVFQDELTDTDGLLLRGTKLIVPSALRPRMLQLAHEGHPGETVMKRRLRDRVWWPGMDREIVSLVTKCEGCRLVAAPSRPEPMMRKALPTGPWIDVAMDFLGPLPTGEHILVIIDYYSRYKEIEVMTRITARETVDRLERIFCRLGTREQ